MPSVVFIDAVTVYARTVALVVHRSRVICKVVAVVDALRACAAITVGFPSGKARARVRRIAIPATASVPTTIIVSCCRAIVDVRIAIFAHPPVVTTAFVHPKEASSIEAIDSASPPIIFAAASSKIIIHRLPSVPNSKLIMLRIQMRRRKDQRFQIIRVELLGVWWEQRQCLMKPMHLRCSLVNFV
jgi:hypothetical protein